jgi:hypothetical protein
MFEHAYNYFKGAGYEFNLIHINPVFSSDAKVGSVRRLTEDTVPLPVSNWRFLETQLIFDRMIEHRDEVKSLLISKFEKLLS